MRALLVSLLSLCACEGVLSGPRLPLDVTAPTAGAEAGGGGGGLEPLPWKPPTCTEARCVGASGLQRITALEYQNAMVDVLGVWPDLRGLPADGAVAGAFFTNDGTVLRLDDVDRYREVAEQIAAATMAADSSGNRPIDALVTRAGTPCATRNATCARALIRSIGARLSRRPLDAQEAARFFALYDWAVAPATDAELTTGAGGTFDDGMQFALELILQSPGFLYRPETGIATGDPAIVRLTSHELAARLAAFLLRSVPDDELLAAAERGEFETPEQLEAQARRLLASTEGDRVWWFFAQDWLSTRNVKSANVQAPEWDAATARDLPYDVHQTFAYLARTDGKLSTLLTSSGGVLQGDSLEWLVGVTGPRGAWASALPGRRGLLTLPGVIIGNTHGGFTRAHQRGLFIRSRLLCQAIPPPGASLAAAVASAQQSEESQPSAATSRGRLMAVTEGNVTCASCHRYTNRVGYALEGTDDLGRERTSELGADGVNHPIDSSGSLDGIAGSPLSTDVDGPFANGDELLSKLAHSKTVEACVARQLARFALQRDLSAADQPSLDAVAQRAAASGADLREMVIAITGTESFRHRRAQP